MLTTDEEQYFMKSMVLTSLNGRLNMINLPTPTYGPDEVLIEVLATSLNFADTLLIAGTYQEKPMLPFAPGMEVCGIVKKYGENVRKFETGQRVTAYVGFGGLAEFVSVKQSLCFSLPENISNEKAASLLIAYGSTELALNYKANLQETETLVVLGASGGVGLSAIQIGKAMGAFVVAVSRGHKKCLLAKSVGANLVLDSNKVDISQELKRLKEIDVVFDPVGGSQFSSALAAAKPETRIIPIGFASGEVPKIPANIIMVKNVTLIGFQIGTYRSFKPDVLEACFNRLINMWSNNSINPHVTSIFSLEQSNEAIDLIKNRQSKGKVVVSLRN